MKAVVAEAPTSMVASMEIIDLRRVASWLGDLSIYISTSLGWTPPAQSISTGLGLYFLFLCLLSRKTPWSPSSAYSPVHPKRRLVELWPFHFPFLDFRLNVDQTGIPWLARTAPSEIVGASFCWSALPPSTPLVHRAERHLAVKGRIAFLGGRGWGGSGGRKASQSKFRLDIITSGWRLIALFFLFNCMALVLSPVNEVNRREGKVIYTTFFRTEYWLVGGVCLEHFRSRLGWRLKGSSAPQRKRLIHCQLDYTNVELIHVYNYPD